MYVVPPTPQKRNSLIPEEKNQNSTFSGKRDGGSIFCAAERVAAYKQQSEPGRAEYRVPVDTIQKSRPSPLLDHQRTGKISTSF
jgi:hypothetical protein